MSHLSTNTRVNFVLNIQIREFNRITRRCFLFHWRDYFSLNFYRFRRYRIKVYYKITSTLPQNFVFLRKMVGCLSYYLWLGEVTYCFYFRGEEIYSLSRMSLFRLKELLLLAEISYYSPQHCPDACWLKKAYLF